MSDQKQFDQVLRRLLETPPQPRTKKKAVKKTAKKKTH